MKECFNSDGCLSITIDSEHVGTRSGFVSQPVQKQIQSVQCAAQSHGETLNAATQSSDPDPRRKTMFHLLSLSLVFRTKAHLALRYVLPFHSFVHPILACFPIRKKHKAKKKTTKKHSMLVEYPHEFVFRRALFDMNFINSLINQTALLTFACFVCVKLLCAASNSNRAKSYRPCPSACTPLCVVLPRFFSFNFMEN